MRLLLRALLLLGLLVALVLMPLPLRGAGFTSPALVPAALASPGLCVGPVCGDEITRSAKHHWQLRLRLSDQQGQRERLVVDCRNARISPEGGAVDRVYAAAVARRVCRLAGQPPTPEGSQPAWQALAGG